MRRGSIIISLILSVLLISSGIWLGSVIQDNTICETGVQQSQSLRMGNVRAGTRAQNMEDLLGQLLILDVAIPPCIAAGFLTAQEIKKSRIYSIHQKK